MPVYIPECFFLLVLYQYLHCDDLTVIAPKFFILQGFISLLHSPYKLPNSFLRNSIGHRLPHDMNILDQKTVVLSF